MDIKFVAEVTLYDVGWYRLSVSVDWVVNQYSLFSWGSIFPRGHARLFVRRVSHQVTAESGVCGWEIIKRGTYVRGHNYVITVALNNYCEQDFVEVRQDEMFPHKPTTIQHCISIVSHTTVQCDHSSHLPCMGDWLPAIGLSQHSMHTSHGTSYK